MRANLLEQFLVNEQNADELPGPDFNVAPTRQAPVVIARAPRDAGEDAESVRQLRSFRWGLLPDQLGRTLRSATPSCVGYTKLKPRERVHRSDPHRAGCRTGVTRTPLNRGRYEQRPARWRNADRTAKLLLIGHQLSVG